MIRLYQDSDYELLKSWWVAADEMPPVKEMMTTDSTFVLEDQGKPVMSITVYLTNCKLIAYLENFIKDPKFVSSQDSSKLIVSHAEEFARKQGFKVLACFSYKEKLKYRYQKLGYMHTCDNLSSFVKIL